MITLVVMGSKIACDVESTDDGARVAVGVDRIVSPVDGGVSHAFFVVRATREQAVRDAQDEILGLMNGGEW
jgi:hypothetical protein